MSVEERRGRRGNLAFARCAPMLLLVMASCVSPGVPPPGSLGQELLRVDHVEAGDGPTAWALIVLADGRLCLDKVGKRHRCRWISEAELRELRAAIQRDEFLAAPGYVGYKGHTERLQVHAAGKTRVFLANALPEAVRAVMVTLDKLYVRTWGQRYNWLLVDREGGS